VTTFDHTRTTICDAEILLKVALNTMTLTLKHHSTNVGFLITVTMLEGILRNQNELFYLWQIIFKIKVFPISLMSKIDLKWHYRHKLVFFR
jgi:hypothetical protein